jgi:U32 family peptidase
MKKNPELILPGGDLKRVKIAIDYGADAVYIGLDKHSLRKGGVNFTIPEMKEAIKYAHKHSKKIYITFNIFAHNQQLKEIEEDMKSIAKLGPDAFIIADIGLISMAKRVAPEVSIHVSTQANTVNIEDAKFWRDQGIKRIVLARELTLPEIAEIHKTVPEIELEVFVHGAMCISYSGRCLLSNYMTGRKANLGECAQPCRWNYNVYLEEKLRPGELFLAEENEKGTAIMSSKDLRLIRHLPEIINAGVTGLKVEGRNKTEYYLAATALAYREALDLIDTGKYTEGDKKRLESELEKLNYRDYTTGFIMGEAIMGETYGERSPIRKWDYLGIVEEQMDKKIHKVIVKNQIVKGDGIEILTSKGVKKDQVISISSLDGEHLDVINPGKKDQMAIIALNNSYPINCLLRKEIV